MTGKKIYCNDFDPTASGAASMYAFAQKDDETLQEAALRAAKTVIECGINELGPYVGTNHVMANNAAFAFSDKMLCYLKGHEDSSEEMVAAVELLEARKEQVTSQQEAARWAKFMQEARSRGKALTIGFAKAMQLKEDCTNAANENLARMKRLKPYVLGLK